jgi:UDP-3-O-[3-hydroxymyristoyl] glucosamine N-acyltransferase
MTLAEVAKLVNGALEGDGSIEMAGVAGLREADPGDVAFLASPKYAEAMARTKASAVLVRRDWSGAAPCAVIRVDNPEVAFTRLVMATIPPPVQHRPGIHPTAVVAEGVVLGSGVAIEAHCVLEPGAKVGDRTVVGAGCYLGHGASVGKDGLLYPHVTLRERCRIGDRAIVHCGAVIGSDGFGYEPDGERWRKIPQVGIVDIGDDVEIGANVTIDRARFGKTVIGNGVKLDNLIQIAHNVKVGANTAMAAQAAVAGSAIIGRHCQIGGQSAIVGHITVGDNVMLAGSSNIIRDVPSGSILMGYAALPHMEFKRIQAVTGRLPELSRKIADILKRLAALEKDAGKQKGGEG